MSTPIARTYQGHADWLRARVVGLRVAPTELGGGGWKVTWMDGARVVGVLGPTIRQALANAAEEVRKSDG